MALTVASSSARTKLSLHKNAVAKVLPSLASSVVYALFSIVCVTFFVSVLPQP